jgi:hypothetical protein
VELKYAEVTRSTAGGLVVNQEREELLSRWQDLEQRRFCAGVSDHSLDEARFDWSSRWYRTGAYSSANGQMPSGG